MQGNLYFRVGGEGGNTAVERRDAKKTGMRINVVLTPGKIYLRTSKKNVLIPGR